MGSTRVAKAKAFRCHAPVHPCVIYDRSVNTHSGWEQNLLQTCREGPNGLTPHENGSDVWGCHQCRRTSLMGVSMKVVRLRAQVGLERCWAQCRRASFDSTRGRAIPGMSVEWSFQCNGHRPVRTVVDPGGAVPPRRVLVGCSRYGPGPPFKFPFKPCQNIDRNKNINRIFFSCFEP